MAFSRVLAALAACLFAAQSLAGAETIPVYDARLLDAFTTSDARQGVAVDGEAFYAVGNTRITRHDKASGEPLARWRGDDELIHLDSGTIRDGLLYAAHSNYPGWPMTSSIEVWDARTLEHVRSHSFGIQLGSLTWLDYHDGHWWAAFGNYDKVQAGMEVPYGTTAATQLVRMNGDFEILQRWVYPEALQAHFTPMSNSGGSWGPDGLLYITGHDHGEIYVVRPPRLGSEVEWLATVRAPQIEGQGIAWDRSAGERVLWGILKRERRVFRLAVPEVRSGRE